MHYKKESDNPLAVKVMPKQHYQCQSAELQKEQWNKKLKEDIIVVEEPLQISLSYYDLASEQYQTNTLSITMRTPGHDRELIHGFLLCEGIINEKNDITGCEFNTQQHQGNAVCVVLAKHVQPNWRAIERQFTSHSSCGICGKTSLNALQLKAPVSTENKTTINRQNIFQLPELLRQHQTIFSQTGGSHAAGLYSADQFLAAAEDIGRHNAVDKVIGMNCLTETSNEEMILVLSGRISFELVQKAIMANIHIIVAVGAPSALAVKAAKKFNVTLIGFTKTDSFNVYHGDWRVLAA
ncbi:formate dehydrogenase accessory sulfurtransferase FdhD [Psychromonas aquimarina]|uniref:formate dehydrogenase accessory sulfurtransferase FdhD n=1 Tax=Psychromonas aquimarina TaxID=444919 RepID=UPI00040FAC68|nr:formate dehydrogenase accessory sulfurtransferase FdhD [Psychromonas aquimarina]